MDLPPRASRIWGERPPAIYSGKPLLIIEYTHANRMNICTKRSALRRVSNSERKAQTKTMGVPLGKEKSCG